MGMKTNGTAGQNITLESAIIAAGTLNYRVETHRQTTGDCWDVRIYSTADEYVKRGYLRTRDVLGANVGSVVMAMLTEVTS
jgi:hypothetical protein